MVQGTTKTKEKGVRTAREHRQELEAQGMYPHAIDLLVRAAAPERHAHRVQATIDTAIDAVKWLAPWAIALDLHGTGGHMGSGGHGGTSQRNSVFASLGKGRWRASDGDAYRAAAEDAYMAICSHRPTVSCYIDDDDTLTLKLEIDSSHVFQHPIYNPSGLSIDEWLGVHVGPEYFDTGRTLSGFKDEMIALARHAVLFFGGYTKEDNSPVSVIAAPGADNTKSLQDWSAVLEWLETTTGDDNNEV